MGLMQLGLEGSPDADPSSSEWTFAHGAARSYCCKGHTFVCVESFRPRPDKLRAVTLLSNPVGGMKVENQTVPRTQGGM